MDFLQREGRHFRPTIVRGLREAPSHGREILWDEISHSECRAINFNHIALSLRLLP